MFEQFVERENAIFGVLQGLMDGKMDFIVIGGYAVSAYKHRFSVDADIAIQESDKEKFCQILEKRKFTKTISKELDHVYAPEFMRYENLVSIDLLIGGVGSRLTDASFSFEELKKHSSIRKIIGSEKQVSVLVPDREILVVLKLHSGRLTDFRDIAAIAKDLDIDLINKFIWRGKKFVLKENIEKMLSLIDRKDFINSFKGVFAEKKYEIDIKSVKELKRLIG